MATATSLSCPGCGWSWAGVNWVDHAIVVKAQLMISPHCVHLKDVASGKLVLFGIRYGWLSANDARKWAEDYHIRITGEVEFSADNAATAP